MDFVVVNKNFEKVYMPLACDRKRLERVLVLGATLGWVDPLKRRIREIRGLYGHVAHCRQGVDGVGR